MRKPHENWMFFAKDDLAFARVGLKDGFYSHVCFLSQQAVEKAMKGYLISQKKDYPKTHGLVTLHRLTEVGWLDPHLGSLKKLSEFYVPLRYPDAVVGALPECMPDEEDAAEALKWAEDIVALIESHINDE